MSTSTTRTIRRSRGRQYPARPGNRKRRGDALPELTDFTDEGCEFSPSCLRCPLERCRYDEPGGARQLRRDPRDEAIRVKRAEGVDISALAEEYGLTRRSVFRILAQGR